MLRLELLPARHGDALWLEYGHPSSPHRMLIDGGPRSRRLREILTGRLTEIDHLDLLVVTHIDADHISGILDIFEDPTVPLSSRDIWFNAWQHLPTDQLGASQGEALSGTIRRRRLPWNRDFDEKAVVTPDEGDLPAVTLPDGLVLTVLSPTRQALADLRPVWKREVEKAGLIPGKAAEQYAAQADLLGDARIDPEELAKVPYEDDRSEANGASIAMLAEFEGKALLLTGDAHGGILAAGLRRLARQRGVDRIRLDAFKLPHHGSKYNLSPDVLNLIECERYLVSTNGDIFGHPDPVAVSRIVAAGDDVTLEFNYRAVSTERWDSSRMRRRFRYRTVYPEHETAGLIVDL
jgi:hypothetical protein